MDVMALRQFRIMRLSLLTLVSLAALAACGQSGSSRSETGGVRLDCALAGEAGFKRICTLDRVASNNGLELVVHNPDGGFHRLLVTSDGRGVIAADGADPASVTIIGKGAIEVAIGGDRYHLPATIKGPATP